MILIIFTRVQAEGGLGPPRPGACFFDSDSGMLSKVEFLLVNLSLPGHKSGNRPIDN